MLKDDLTLNFDDPRDENDPDLGKNHYKVLLLDSYIVYKNEKNLPQPHYDYVYQD
jgi:hypothetical protein